MGAARGMLRQQRMMSRKQVERTILRFLTDLIKSRETVKRIDDDDDEWFVCTFRKEKVRIHNTNNQIGQEVTIGGVAITEPPWELDSLPKTLIEWAKDRCEEQELEKAQHLAARLSKRKK